MKHLSLLTLLLVAACSPSPSDIKRAEDLYRNRDTSETYWAVTKEVARARWVQQGGPVDDWDALSRTVSAPKSVWDSRIALDDFCSKHIDACEAARRKRAAVGQ